MDTETRLVWLIDPFERKVYTYLPGLPVEELENSEHLTGDPILSGFTLELREIW